MDLATLSNIFCWIASSILLLLPLQKVVLRRQSLYSLDVMVSSLVWIMYFPYLGGVVLGLIQLQQGRATTVTTALWFALACNIAWWIGRLLTGIGGSNRRTGPRQTITDPSFGDDALPISLTKVLLVLGVVGFLFQMLALPNHVFSYELSRTALLAQKNHRIWLIGSYLNLNLLIAVGIATVHRLHSPRLFQTTLFLFIATSLVTFIQIRSRTFVIAGLFVLIFVFATRQSSRRLTAPQALQRIRGLRLWRMALFAVSIFLIAGVLQGARGAISGGMGEFWNYFRRLDVAAELERAFLQEDLAYSEWYIASLEVFPQQHPFLGGTSYFVWPLQFIPRSIIPWKPEDTQIVFCRVVRPSMAYEGGTIPPSIYGDAYINFGYIGFLIFAPFGIILRLIDSYCVSRRQRSIGLGILVAIISGTAPHFARGGFHNAMCLVVFVFGVVQILTVLLRDVRRQRQRGLPRRQHLSHQPRGTVGRSLRSARLDRRAAAKR